MTRQRLIIPEWPAPANVSACTTLRSTGTSSGKYHGFNLADYVGDDIECVTENRRQLRNLLQLPSEPVWLQQEHGNRIVNTAAIQSLQADGAIAFQPGKVCAVLTADCLPLLLCNNEGTCVAAIHAGWKGLLNGIIPAAVKTLQCQPDDLLAWMGPAIGPDAYQIGDDVRDAFVRKDEEYALAFLPVRPGKWMANLYQIAYLQLRATGVSEIYGGIYCTYIDGNSFFSFRRDQQTGRMASLIWMQS